MLGPQVKGRRVGPAADAVHGVRPEYGMPVRVVEAVYQQSAVGGWELLTLTLR